MAVDLTTPDFNFSGFYYPELVEAQVEYLRKNVPEISNENPFEPSVQLVRAFALIGHLNNTLLDMVANETTIPTASLRDSVVRLVALIGYVPHANIPAKAELRAKLSSGFNTSTLVVSDNSLFGTKRQANLAPVLYEADEAITIDRTDEVGAFVSLDFSGPTWVDETSDANANSSTFSLFPENYAEFDCFYIMHPNVLTDELAFSGIAATTDFGDDRASDPRIIVYEYFDGDVEDAAPDSVANQGTTLKIVIDGLLGTSAIRTGQYATVTLNATGVSEELLIQHDGTNNYVVTTGFLSQTTPSTDVRDYTVGVYWHEITGITDTTKATLPVSGEASATGDGILQAFTGTLARYPLEPGTSVTFSYLVSGVAKTAVFRADDSISGDADEGTTVNRETGAFVLNTVGVPDVGAITVAYTREQQPFQQDGSVSFAVPKDDVDDWIPASLSNYLTADLSEGAPSTTGLWIRCRIVSLGDTPTTISPTYDRVRWDQGSMYIAIDVTQGRTFAQEVFGSGDGTENQSFGAANSPVIEGSVIVSVDGDLWTQVDDFASSGSTDKHYIVRVDSEGVATVTFGDGANGAAPPTGTNNVTAEYRVGGAEDGNVGRNRIKVNRSGLTRVKQILNPRAASGWIQQEGATETTLSALKRDAVASLRDLGRAVSTSDLEVLSKRWKSSDGQKPFARARAIQNGYGPKTIKLVVVPVGAGTSSPTVRAAFDAYANGNLHTGGDEPGVLVANTECTTVDYTPKVIDVVVEITGGDKETVETAVKGFIHPESVLDNGEYRWKFGATVALAKLSATIFNADSANENVNLTSPASDTVLEDDELPVLGTLTVTVAS